MVSSEVRNKITFVGVAIVHFVLIIQCTGMIYGVGNLIPYITSFIGTKTGYVSMHSTHVIFYIGILMWSVSFQPAIYLQSKYSPKKIIYFGTFIYVTTVFLGSVLVTRTAAIIFGIFLGIGSGFGYGPGLIIALHCYPARKGMVTGIIVGSFAIGSFVFNLVCTAIINPNNKKPTIEKTFEGHTDKFFDEDICDNLPKMFWILGSIFFVLISIGLLMIKDVNWKEEHAKAHTKEITQDAHSVNPEYVHEFNLNKEELVEVKMRPRIVSAGLRKNNNIGEVDESEKNEINSNSFHKKQWPEKIENGEIEDNSDKKIEIITASLESEEIANSSRKYSIKSLPELRAHQSEKVVVHDEDKNLDLNSQKRKSLQYSPDLVGILPTENRKLNCEEEEEVKNEEDDEVELQLDILEHQPQHEITFRHALKTRNFYIIFFTTMFAGTAGMFSLANFKVVGLEYGYDDSFLTIVGSLGSIMNGTNRPFWGMLFDKNYKLVYRIVCVLASSLCFTFPYVAGIKPLFAIWIMVLYSCSGATITQLAPISIKLYGREVGFRVYATLFLANGCAGMTVYVTQDYIAYYISANAVYFIIGGLACVAFIIVSFFRPKIIA